MSLAQRRLLFAFFVILFLAIVPIVLLFATGQRINWRRFELEATSSLIIDSNPSGAQVLVNGEPPSSLSALTFGKRTTTTKLRLSDLSPEEYVVRLEKDGYWPWETRLTLHPGEAANLGTVKLFRKQEPDLILTEEKLADEIIFASDKKQAALLASDAVTILNLESTEAQPYALPFDSEQDIAAWSPDSRRFIAKHRVIDTVTGVITDISKILKNVPGQIRWNADTSGRLALLDGAAIKEFDPATNALATQYDIAPHLSDKLVADFQVRGSRLYLLMQSSSGSNQLVIKQLNDREETTIDLPSGQYGFSLPNHEDPIIINHNTRQLYIIEEPVPFLQRVRLTAIAPSFSTGDWERSALWYSTPFELRRWDKSNAQDNLLARFSDPIIGMALIAETDYLVSATQQILTVRHRYNPQSTDTLDILTAETIESIDISPDGTRLYFYGFWQGQPGMYRLPV